MIGLLCVQGFLALNVVGIAIDGWRRYGSLREWWDA